MEPLDELDDNTSRHDVVEKIIDELPKIENKDAMKEILDEYHVADVAEALHELPDEIQNRVIEFMDPEDQGEILEEANEDDAAEYVEDMPPQKLAEIVGSMPRDEAADLMNSMTRSRAESILSLLPREDASEVRELLRYEPDTAGGIMTNDFIQILPEMKVEQIRELLKKEELEEDSLGTLVVCRSDMKFLGLVSVEDLFAADHDTAAGELVERATVTVGPNADQEVCAQYMTKYDLPVLPVVDPRRRIIGLITFDDIFDVMDEEASEDMYRMAGVGVGRPLDDGAIVRAFRRLPWFVISLIGMSILGFIISRFEVTISKVVAISYFIPAIMGLGGNVGIQASTITVRGIAKGEILFGDLFWLLRREILVGVIIGLFCGTALAFIAGEMTSEDSFLAEELQIQDDGQVVDEVVIKKEPIRPPFFGVIPRFPVTVGLAMFAGIMGSVILGTCIPMLCHRLGVDPALASGPFVTTLIDISTQSLYLILCTYLLIY